jgi:MFS family permease
MDTIGAFVGVGISLLILLLLQQQANAESTFRMLFWLAFLPGAAAVLMIFAVREIPPQPAPVSSSKRVNLHFGPQYYSVLILFSLFSLANSSDAFLLLRAKNLGLSVVLVIAAYLCYNASYSVLSYPIGRLADRMPKERLLALGLAVYAVVYLGFAVTRSPWLVWLLFAGYGIYIAMTEGVSKALISNLVESHVRGTALGLFNMVVGALALASSLLAGILWDKISPSAPFFAGSALALAAAIGFLAIKPKAAYS